MLGSVYDTGDPENETQTGRMPKFIEEWNEPHLRRFNNEKIQFPLKIIVSRILATTPFILTIYVCTVRVVQTDVSWRLYGTSSGLTSRSVYIRGGSFKERRGVCLEQSASAFQIQTWLADLLPPPSPPPRLSSSVTTATREFRI
jgi:hypothetical protein